MKKIDYKKLFSYVAPVLIILAIGIAYFSPALEGKVLNQNDVLQGISSQQEIIKYEKEAGERSLWTNSMFGGMPAYQIGMKTFSRYLLKIRKIFELWMPAEIGFILLYGIGFYILMLSFGLNPWLSLLGALAFTFSSYHFIIIDAGHNWKVRTIAFMAPSLAGFILMNKKKYLLGFAILSFFLSLQFFSNHIQMTYYFFLLVGILFIYFLWQAFQAKEYKHFGIVAGLSIISIIISVGVNATNLYTTYEYGKYSQRGNSNLEHEDDENQTGGLERDYISMWAYGKQETFSIIIPSAKGGGTGLISSNKKALQAVEPQYREQIGQNNKYWGDQTFVGGPDYYFGAVVMFLMVLGMFFIKDKIKWVFFAGFVLSILLCWGGNFPAFTNFFIDYFPLYNKFRAVASILVIAGFCTAILAALALKEIFEEPEIIQKNKKKFYYAFGLTGGLLLLFYLLPETFFDFLSKNEESYFNNYRQTNPQQTAGLDEFVSNLEAARIYIFKSDTIRSFLFILLSAVIAWFYSLKKLKANAFMALVGLLILIDLWGVNARYLNKDSFMTKKQRENTIAMKPVDEFILKDKEYHRVLNLTKSPFQDATTSYYHKSIGGYHGAKLMRYKELIDVQLAQEISLLQKTLQSEGVTEGTIDAVFKKTESLNMLATKYVIYNPNSQPLVNPYAKSDAWFVDSLVFVKTTNEEIEGLNKIELNTQAILNESLSKAIVEQGYKNGEDSTATISLVDYNPNHLTYKSKANKSRVALFSEIYYPKGWNVTVDGKEASYFVANFLLRAMVVPSGEHTIEFEFKPQSYYLGEKVSKASSLILLIVLLGSVSFLVFKK